jgi:hypothetical protein
MDRKASPADRSSPAQLAAWERIWARLLSPLPDEAHDQTQHVEMPERGAPDQEQRRVPGPEANRSHEECN